MIIFKNKKLKQPTPQSIKNSAIYHPPKEYVLLVDGTNLIQVASACHKMNAVGFDYGKIYQFFFQIKTILEKREFKRCYVFFDGKLSGKNRYELYSAYKENRGKVYSDYAQYILNYEKKILSHTPKSEKQKNREEAALHYEMCYVKIREYIEELSMVQILSDDVMGGCEADDLIAYYCQKHHKTKYIYIYSSDNDLEQLLQYEDVCIYDPSMHKFLHKGNFIYEKGIHPANILVKKVFCGDDSDNIKGIAGVGEQTLKDLVPEIDTKPVSIDDVVQKAQLLNEQRVKNKQKPLQSYSNIINRVTEGVQGTEVLEINTQIIDLLHPLLTSEAQRDMDDIIESPIDPEGRGMDNLYRLILRDGIVEWMDNKFQYFFAPFQKLIEHEKKFYSQNR